MKLVTPKHGMAQMISGYYQNNEAHLAPWEPLRPEGFHSVDAWEIRIQNKLDDIAEGKGVFFCVMDDAEEEMLGMCELSNIVLGPFNACNLGFSIAQAHEGNGIMFKAVGEVVTFAFEKLHLHRVMANHMPANRRSAALLEKLGFQEEGLAKSYLKIAGKWEDHVLRAKINPGTSE